jgi:hypothetical protein
MARPTEETIRRLIDRQEITDVINLWSRGAQRKDWDLLRSCYHDDGLDLHGSIDGNVDEFVEWMKGYHATITQVMFCNTNTIIEFVDDDHAFVETNCIGFQRYTRDAQDARVAFLGPEYADKEVEIDMFFAGRYLDQFDRRDGKWRIAKRVVVYEKAEPTEARGPLPGPESGLIVQTRGDDDPLFTERAEAGLGVALSIA